jgi:hypothetical protein
MTKVELTDKEFLVVIEALPVFMNNFWTNREEFQTAKNLLSKLTERKPLEWKSELESVKEILENEESFATLRKSLYNILFKELSCVEIDSKNIMDVTDTIIKFLIYPHNISRKDLHNLITLFKADIKARIFSKDG